MNRLYFSSTSPSIDTVNVAAYDHCTNEVMLIMLRDMEAIMAAHCSLHEGKQNLFYFTKMLSPPRLSMRQSNALCRHHIDLLTATHQKRTARAPCRQQPTLNPYVTFQRLS